MLCFLLCKSALAQTRPAALDLKDGDRVVMLGSSVFENDFQYGYLETMLTTRNPDKGITFRNLGWTGDNVWGEARSTYTNPPTPYEHLIEDLTKSQPTVVVLGYGGVEAQDGMAGLPHFKEGLNKLIDKIDGLGAKTILLSTIPVMSPDTAQHIAQRNADLQLYSQALSEVASQRGKMFVDIYKSIDELSKKEQIIENTVHLNELGYFHLAQILEKALGLEAAPATTTITLGKGGPQASNARILPLDGNAVLAKFNVIDKYLPLPAPAGSQVMDNARTVIVSGLKKGFYALMAGNEQVASGSASAWAKGIAIAQGPQFEQTRWIQEMVNRKNELHFFQYRPLNQTYIIGFRKYEQGRHVKGLEEQNILIKWLEGQIILKSVPKETVYELKKVE
ncbi:GDSL family lipase [Dyadobacter sandarakinus]|uniref:GDSL family lipase n=2 Tax=Dyadobacter sandarakinus TaxID=2747268 RepID=A0ABX7IDT2_9BACT|nr:GDSL family lipase [Dyadobacter sandarakinus]